MKGSCTCILHYLKHFRVKRFQSALACLRPWSCGEVRGCGERASAWSAPVEATAANTK